MKNDKRESKIEKSIKKLIKTIAGILVIFISLKLYSPTRFDTAISMSGRYAKEMLSIFPAVLLIMGLADVWVPTTLVKKYLGREAKIKGKFLACFLGTLPTGPMYIAFPLAAELLRKKASVSNVIIFLGVWASLKIPQIGVEIKFMGIKFALLRLIFTLVSVVLIGIFVERLIKDSDIKQKEHKVSPGENKQI